MHSFGGKSFKIIKTFSMEFQSKSPGISIRFSEGKPWCSSKRLIHCGMNLRGQITKTASLEIRVRLCMSNPPPNPHVQRALCSGTPFFNRYMVLISSAYRWKKRGMWFYSALPYDICSTCSSSSRMSTWSDLWNSMTYTLHCFKIIENK